MASSSSSTDKQEVDDLCRILFAQIRRAVNTYIRQFHSPRYVLGSGCGMEWFFLYISYSMRLTNNNNNPGHEEEDDENVERVRQVEGNGKKTPITQHTQWLVSLAIVDFSLEGS